MIGGELKGMTKALVESRDEVQQRLVEAAEARGANAVVAMRFDTSSMGDGQWTEICAYGTAVRRVELSARRAAAERVESDAMPDDLEGRATELLQALVRLNTVNPPGNETPAIDLLERELADAGFECERFALDPERPNLVARLRGEADGPRLGYLGHVDTVLASPEDWSRDPWSGDVVDGFLWGRGALDMKSQVAAEVAAGVTLARSGWRPARGELLVHVRRRRGDRRRVRRRVPHQAAPGRRALRHAHQRGRRAVDRSRRRAQLHRLLRARRARSGSRSRRLGRAGHASMPNIADNALLKLAPVLDRLGAGQPSFRLTDEPAALMEAFGADPSDLDTALERAREVDPVLGVLLEPTLGITFAPTRVAASEKVNVIPARARLQVDCRVPPGLGEAEVREDLAEVLGDMDDLELEFHGGVVGNRSPIETELMGVLGDLVAEEDPGARVVPTVLPGFTDSRWYRAAFPDCIAYGFFPHRAMSMIEVATLIHSSDERIDVRDLALAARCYHELPRRLLG